MFLFGRRTRSFHFDATRGDVSLVVVLLTLSVVCRRLDAASVTSTSRQPSSLASSSATVVPDSSLMGSAPIVDGVTSSATPSIGADETTSNSAAGCALWPSDPFQHVIVDDMVTTRSLNLIQYVLLFPNSSANPLTHNLTRTLKVNIGLPCVRLTSRVCVGRPSRLQPYVHFRSVSTS